MAQILIKLVADEGQFYIGYDESMEIFTTPPILNFSELMRIIAIEAEDVDADDQLVVDRISNSVMNSKIQLDITTTRIQAAKSAIELLRQGNALPLELACNLDQFEIIISAVVPEEQGCDEENWAWMEKLVEESGIRTPDLDHYDAADILDLSEEAIFKDAWNLTTSHSVLSGAPTSQQCRLYGEYLARYLEISRLALDNPLDVIKASVRNG